MRCLNKLTNTSFANGQEQPHEHEQSVHALLEQARSSLGPFCSNVCKAKCCKRGKLLLEKNQVDILCDVKDQKPPLLVARENGYFDFHIGLSGCPRLTKDSKCRVYEKRPQMCRDYPLFERGETILVSSACEGFIAGKLDPYLDELKKKKKKIIVA